MFASVHAYYVTTYGITSAVAIIELITLGLSMSITYYWSGGNILVPALIHGIYDATGFLAVATTTQIGLAARFIMIFVGIGFAIVYLPKKIAMRQNPKPSIPPETTPKTQPPPNPPQM
jgi:membrane protease YdiL (CAAX protease family)